MASRTALVAFTWLSLAVVPGAWGQTPDAVAPLDPTRAAGPHPSCPLLVPPRESFLQPLRLTPAQVPRKNAAGCLSAADAVYRADGCPEKLCPKARPGLEL